LLFTAGYQINYAWTKNKRLQTEYELNHFETIHHHPLAIIQQKSFITLAELVMNQVPQVVSSGQ
jgi:hypothetical protein